MCFECKLWFDVGIKRYTTATANSSIRIALWFDVGIKRYTTCISSYRSSSCCGLM